LSRTDATAAIPKNKILKTSTRNTGINHHCQAVKQRARNVLAADIGGACGDLIVLV
jgi:hypothetical protein